MPYEQIGEPEPAGPAIARAAEQATYHIELVFTDTGEPLSWDAICRRVLADRLQQVIVAGYDYGLFDWQPGPPPYSDTPELPGDTVLYRIVEVDPEPRPADSAVTTCDACGRLFTVADQYVVVTSNDGPQKAYHKDCEPDV